MTVSARPSRSDAAAPGCECASSPASASSCSIAARWSVSFQAARSLRLTAPVAFGEVIEDVAFLVTDAALNGDVAEDSVNGGAEGLAAVQDDQDALVAVQAAVDEVREQLDADALVLRRAVPQPERDLDAVGRDAERDDAAAALELEAVEHQRREANVLPATAP